jgi:hypothetical protein
MLSKIGKNTKFQIVCHEATVPFSFYQLSADIATVSCDFRDIYGTTKTANITLTAGNYNCNTVLIELATQLYNVANTSAGAYVRFQPTFSFTYSSTSGLSTLAMSAPASAQIIIKFSTNTLLGKFFGFTANATMSTVLTPVSTQTCVANPVNCLFLRCSSLRQEYNREWMVQKGAFSDIVYKIPIFSQQNTYIGQSVEGDPIYVLDNNISQLNFYLSTNLSYSAIDLRGVDNFNFSFSIREVVIPDYIPITDSVVANIAPPTTDEGQITEEEKVLLDEKQRQLDKLEKYKKKLEAKNKTTNKDVVREQKQ